ncbi:hypothetical protein [Massiliimalia massiliensis]|uniref:hypothetical protein n=1 Tax=Massiliimalia massiliensis TaxID=1852384 RepID=UPI0013566105|nr:hypothetical protein [Massiliimalia massiliensis]
MNRICHVPENGGMANPKFAAFSALQAENWDYGQSWIDCRNGDIRPILRKAWS